MSATKQFPEGHPRRRAPAAARASVILRRLSTTPYEPISPTSSPSSAKPSLSPCLPPTSWQPPVARTPSLTATARTPEPAADLRRLFTQTRPSAPQSPTKCVPPRRQGAGGVWRALASSVNAARRTPPPHHKPLASPPHARTAASSACARGCGLRAPGRRTVGGRHVRAGSPTHPSASARARRAELPARAVHRTLSALDRRRGGGSSQGPGWRDCLAAPSVTHLRRSLF